MEQRNLILAVVLSVAIIVAFDFFGPKKPPPPAPIPTVEAAQATDPGATATAPVNGAAAGTATLGINGLEAGTASRASVLGRDPRVQIITPRLAGSINLHGARLDDLILKDYHEGIDPESPAITLLSPAGTPHAYRAGLGWLTGDPAVKVPDDQTLWQAPADARLTPSTPVTLTWDNGAGLTFTRVISVDPDYVFTITDSVANGGSAPVALRPYALIARSGEPPVSQSSASYEGPIGAFSGVTSSIAYTKVASERIIENDSKGGWFGFTDKYWLTAIAPKDQGQSVRTSFRHDGTGATQTFQTDFLGTTVTIAPGASVSQSDLVFTGAKEVKLLNHYEESLGLKNFVYAVDFGWFYFLTKPIFYLLDYIYGLVGNFGVAILILTVIMKALFFPLQTKAVLSMNKMKAIAPEIKKLQEKFPDDRARVQQETMNLYKKAGANPLAGCLPILLQIPVFFSVYKVLSVTLEMRHAPFYGWIHDLSEPDPTTIFNAFGLIPWTPPHFLMIGAWPLIYCASMFVTQRMQPPPPDPVQARMMQFMPLFLTFMLGFSPVGLVIYWSWSNLLTMAQQYVITRRFVVPTPVKA